MREYGTLYTEFWIDPITRALTDDAKLLAIYCLSSPHTTSLGCFRAPLAYLTDDLNWSLERVRKALNNCSDIGFLIYDESTSWLFIPKFLKWNVIGNPNQWVGIKNLLQKVPKSISFYPQLIQAILNYVRHISDEEKKGLETLTKPFLNQEQEQEQDQKQKPEQDQITSPAEQTQEDAIQQVFQFWQKTFNHSQAKLDKKRKSVIQKALKAGYTVVQLCEAITGCSLTAHNLGYNERGQRYDGLGIILRDADNIDRFIRNCHNPPPMPKSTKTNALIHKELNYDEFAHKQYPQTPVEDIHWLHAKTGKTAL